MERDLLNAMNTMEELLMGGEIEKYTYSSEDGFTYYYALDEHTSELEAEEIGLYDIDREYIIEQIAEARREAEEDSRAYNEQRERDYWEVQGVRY